MSGVREGYLYSGTKYVEGWVEFHLAVEDETIICPHCQGSEYWRRINTLPIGPKAVVLEEAVPKCECLVCGKSFEPPLPPPTYTTAVLEDAPHYEIRREPCYPPHEPPVFFGHYWLPPHHLRTPLTSNLACLDISTTRGDHPFVAYRWLGESILKVLHFVQ